MGFELGPKALRRKPSGWLPARAFPVCPHVYSQLQGPDAGESLLEMSAGLIRTAPARAPRRARRR